MGFDLDDDDGDDAKKGFFFKNLFLYKRAPKIDWNRET